MSKSLGEHIRAPALPCSPAQLEGWGAGEEEEEMEEMRSCSGLSRPQAGQLRWDPFYPDTICIGHIT